jgi:hypothetical protein
MVVYLGIVNNKNQNIMTLANQLFSGSVVTFKDGETWIVVNPINQFDIVLMRPFGETKNNYVSIAIDFTLAYIEQNAVKN